MSIKTKNSIDSQLAGIQLAIFELIWPTFRWIEKIYLSSGDDKSCPLYIQVAAEVSSEELNNCRELMDEILAAAFGKEKVGWTLAFGLKSPEMQTDMKEIMSSEIFKIIAMEVAPWRLGQGR